VTLLAVVKAVCSVVGVEQPTSVFSNIIANRTMQEMLDLANEMAQRIAYDNREWTLFRNVGTLVGDGTTTAFPLPVNFKRMLLTTNLWRSTSALTPMRFIVDFDDWNNRRQLNIYSGYGEWTIYGGNIVIAPVLATGQTATYGYLDKNCIDLNSGGFGDSFQSDSDGFRLDERLLKLGMIWQWKSQKGAAYNEELGTYSDAMAVAMGSDSPGPIYIGRQTVSSATKIAYPFGPVPTP
jgi:hypothetical protein